MENEGFFPNLDERTNVDNSSKGTLKRGLGSRQLLESEIREAQKISPSAKGTARTLGVSYNTYKKYAKMYGIFDIDYNPTNVPIERRLKLTVGKYPLSEILQGMHPNYPIYKLKRRLIKNDVFPEQCSCCGFEEVRVTDGKAPLLLDFFDGNWQNHKLENLRFLCYNCFFLLIGKRKIPKDGQYIEQGIVGDEDDEENIEEDLEDSEI
jgi:hypothetical protein